MTELSKKGKMKATQSSRKKILLQRKTTLDMFTGQIMQNKLELQ